MSAESNGTGGNGTASRIFTRPGRHRVAVLVRHGVLPIELGIVHRILGGATAEGRRLYQVVTCATEPGPVRTTADFTIHVEHGPEALDEADTVIVPAAHNADDGYGPGALPAPLAAALRRVRPGARLASICTGAFVLAAAGLLDGRRATTHWISSDRFRALHPRVRLDPDVLYTEDRTEAGCPILTSAGVASATDLCLHLVRSDFGSAVATAIARRTVVPPHRDGGQAQYIERPVPAARLHTTGNARAWALDRLHQPLTLRELAERESMSVRTFTRRFREETGLSPLRWLTQQRVERARQLLEESQLPVDRVAEVAGFGTAASMRQHLLAALGVSPSAYRRTFRGTPYGPPPNGQRAATYDR